MTVARLAVATGQPIGDLLAAPPSVLSALIAAYDEHVRRQQVADQGTCRDLLGRGHGVFQVEDDDIRVQRERL